MSTPWARFVIEVTMDRDEEDELDDIAEELREEIIEMIDRYSERGFKVELVDS